ncbi:MAG TPA: hypothetical protein ENF52_04660 [Chloroflexi bacterium]|nr:hypothetical protein [Chloroflexota bacterium]
MRHPFDPIPAALRRPVFIPLFMATVLVLFVMNSVGAPLNTDAAPQGIVSYELAGDVPTVQAILESWDGEARVRAGFSLGIDFLFLVLYSTTIAWALVWVSTRLPGRWASVGVWLAWGQWLAAALDSIENAALWRLLVGTVTAPWPQVARWCALVKFALVIVGLLYVVVGGLLSRHRPQSVWG